SGVGVTPPTRTLDIARKDGANVTAEVHRRIYQTYAWGEELQQDIKGYGTVNLTTEYDYHTDAFIYPTYQQVKSVRRPDGSWQGFTYTAFGGSNGLGISLVSPRLVSTRRGPWGDAPNTVTLSGTSGEIVTYSYETAATSPHFSQPTSIVRTAGNQQVS